MGNIRKRRLEAGKPLIFPNIGQRKTLADFGVAETPSTGDSLARDVPTNEAELQAANEQILSREEERARREALDAIRRRVEMRNQLLQRNYGVRGGVATPILGFR